jgi:hypothetical protein
MTIKIATIFESGKGMQQVGMSFFFAELASGDQA